jgi:hypothetical protein
MVCGIDCDIFSPTREKIHLPAVIPGSNSENARRAGCRAAQFNLNRLPQNVLIFLNISI